jgi:phosphoheptose isomerase
MADVCVDALCKGRQAAAVRQWRAPAADAQHLAAECWFGSGPDVNRDGVPAIALALDAFVHDRPAAMTIPLRSYFERMTRALGRPGRCP